MVHDYVMKIPYVNEGFTRMVKRDLAKLGIRARVVATSGTSIQSLIRPKTEKIYCDCEICTTASKNSSNFKICEHRHVVYEVSCRRCSACYNGATNRHLVERIKEHERDVSLGKLEKSTIAEHASTHGENKELISGRRGPDLHNFCTMFNVSIVDRGIDSIETFIKEGLIIEQNKPSMNVMTINGWIR